MVAAALGLVLLTAGLPEREGLAARHPGDRGLAAHASVLLFEDFEGKTLDEVTQRWDSASNRDGKVLALVDGGADRGRCLQITATPGENTGGHLYTRLRRGVECAFARFYVRFPEQAGYIHHFVHLGCYEPPTAWPQGHAGTRPRGHQRFTVGIEPFGFGGREQPPGAWSFYAYWHEMKISADGKYWGNGLQPARPARVPRGRWQCVEVMLRCNTAGERDGELALWLDGRLTAHFRRGAPRTNWSGMGFRLLEEGGEPFEGFSWRKADAAKINFFWLLHYVTERALRRNGVKDPTRPNRVRFDQVVVATEYVGPLVSKRKRR